MIIICGDGLPMKNVSEENPSVEWIREPKKLERNKYIIWKALVRPFHLIGNQATWKIGDGKSVCIGNDPWTNVGNNYMISKYPLTHLHNNWISYLGNAKSNHFQEYGSKAWRLASNIGLQGDLLLNGVFTLTFLFLLSFREILIVTIFWPHQKIERMESTQ